MVLVITSCTMLRWWYQFTSYLWCVSFPIIFPEYHEEFNEIVNEFQDKFIDVAKLYYKKTGKELYFVPMYNAPNLKTIAFGNPIKYDNNIDINEQRKIICDYLKGEITKVAKDLPMHMVVPYKNVSKKKATLLH